MLRLGSCSATGRALFLRGRWWERLLASARAASLIALVASCAGEAKQLPPTLNPSSAEAPEAPNQTPRSLAGPLPREATPLEPSTETSPAMKGHGMSGDLGHGMGGGMKGHDMGGAMKEDKMPADDADNEKASARVNAKPVYTCPMHPDIRQSRPGKCPKCGMKLVPEKNDIPKSDDSSRNDNSQHADETSPAPDTSDTKDKTIYTCPMHPEVRQNRPGKCPKCGMTLVPEKKPPP